MERVQIKDVATVELEAMAYRCTKVISEEQKKLAILQRELLRREQEPAAPITQESEAPNGGN